MERPNGVKLPMRERPDEAVRPRGCTYSGCAWCWAIHAGALPQAIPCMQGHSTARAEPYMLGPFLHGLVASCGTSE